MLLSCLGQRSLSNSGVLEGLLNLLDSLLSPLQQPLAAAQRRTDGKEAVLNLYMAYGFSSLNIWHIMTKIAFYFYILLWNTVTEFIPRLMCFEGVLDIPMISWVVMLVSRLLDYVASIEDEASCGKKQLGGKDRERSFTGMSSRLQVRVLQCHNSQYHFFVFLCDNVV